MRTHASIAHRSHTRSRRVARLASIAHSRAICRTFAPGLSVALLAIADDARAGQVVTLEAVSQYSRCGFSPELPGAVPGATNFINQLQSGANPAGFRQGNFFQNDSVFDIDFLDPDVPGAEAQDADMFGFDQQGGGISYYQGHGDDLGRTQTTQTCCTQAAECNNPAPGTVVGTSGTGTCAFSPISVQPNVCGAGRGLCFYSVTPNLVTCGELDQTHFAPIAPPATGGIGRHMAMGENAQVGAWAGAGTNGGAALAILYMSWGLVPFFPVSEWAPHFAGLQLYASMMPTYGDTSDGATFGQAAAAGYTANPNSQIAADLLNAMASVTDGSGCPAPGSAGGGFNGCGCLVVGTFSSTASNARVVSREHWSDLASGTFTGLQTRLRGKTMGFGCNYNFTTFPMLGGDN